MYFILGFFAVIIAAALIFVVVIQNSKGGGLSSTFGGQATQMMGARRSSEFIEKVTWYLAGGLAVVAFLANIIGPSSTDAVIQSRLQDRIENQIIEEPTQMPDPTQFEQIPTEEDATPTQE
jgi:preprotein translocase subunit SecG